MPPAIFTEMMINEVPTPICARASETANAAVNKLI
jgi:hypothetical protein